MANKPTRRRPSSDNSNRKYEEGLPVETKKQILGFFLFVISVLVTLSIISFSDYDQSKLESITFFDLFSKEKSTSSGVVSNWLGIIGVIISGFFVQNAFGYYSIVIPILIAISGILLMRKKSLFPMLQISLYSILLMLLLSSLSGLLRISLGSATISYSIVGRSGEYFSAIFNSLIGIFGSYLVVVSLTIICFFFLIDRDITKTLARLRNWIASIAEKYSAAKDEIKEKREQEKSRVRTSKTLENERDRIRKAKKNTNEEEISAIKDTKINRPSENELITEKGKNENDLPAEIEIPLEEVSSKEVLETSEETTEAKTKSKKVLQSGESSVVNGNDVPYIQEVLNDFKQPLLDLLDEPMKEELDVISDEELKENGRLLQAKLLNFGVTIEKVIATPGPVVTLYELVPAEDVKLSKIEGLQDDIALAMKAKGIRMIIPIPGRGTVGVEIPNHKAAIVKIKSVIASKKFNDSAFQLPMALGKTISGEVFIDDLAKMPHLLIAGSTGSGKSVGINTIIASLIYKLHPSDLKLMLIDPKKIELNTYAKLSKHYLCSSKDLKEEIITTPQNSVLALKSLEIEMERRYERLANATTRNIQDYNKKFAEGKLKDEENIKHSKMPYIVVVIDELADLMITASREVEEPIARLAQLARAVGIHLILATQRPSVDVITGVIKANFSARIAYLVNSKIDSRTILDMNGADQLLGNGDMLYLPPGVGKPIRIQSPFISSEEVEKVCDFVKAQKGFTRSYELPSVLANKRKSYSDSGERDELFEEAARIIVRYQQGSVSLLQRKLKIGYARAARIVDELEAANVVGPFDGSKAREVLVETEAQLEQLI